MRNSKRLGGTVALHALLFLLLAAPGASRPAAQEGEEAPEPPPVVWESWSEEVFQRAREEQKGILLTVVRRFCLPCQAADREVYSDPVVRLLIHRSWIPVRVDAAERPDLDARYRAAVSVLSRGERGYPVTAFLFPTGEAMWADTFIPAGDREARPGMRSLLDKMDHFWKRRFPEAQRNAMAVQAFFDREDTPRRPAKADRFMVSSVVDHLIARHDGANGGYGAPPRRQNPLAAELMMMASERRVDPGLRRQALEALRGPVRGALFDQLEGGFHKATRSADWAIPWFGKELVVNAAYLHALVEAVRISEDAELASAAGLTVDYILGTLQAPEAGGFYAAQAPSGEDEEPAAYYAWDAESLAGKLGDKDRQWARVLFGFSPEGEPLLGLPPRFTLKERSGAAAQAAEAGLPPEEIGERRSRILGVLSEIRASKDPPPVPRVRYLDSTAMACSALLDAGVVLGREDAVSAALGTLTRLMARGGLDRGLPHALHRPDGSPVLMVDQARLGNALLDAYEVTGEEGFLRAAGETAGALMNLFDSADGAFYDVVEQEDAAGYARIRRKVFHDSVSPSPQVTAGRLLFRLGHIQGEEALVDRAARAFAWGAGRVWELDLTATTLAMAADVALSGPVMVHVDPDSGDPDALRRAALSLYEPARIISTGPAPDRPAAPDASAPGAVMCLGKTCTGVITSPGKLSEALDILRSGGGPRPAAGQAR